MEVVEAEEMSQCHQEDGLDTRKMVRNLQAEQEKAHESQKPSDDRTRKVLRAVVGNSAVS